MNIKHVVSIGLCAGAMFAVSRAAPTRAVTGQRKIIHWMGLWVLVASLPVAAAEPWRIVEQPDLKQALEQAPVLRTESLGEPARGVNVWERWMVPNLDGKSWDVLQVYFK